MVSARFGVRVDARIQRPSTNLSLLAFAKPLLLPIAVPLVAIHLCESACCPAMKHGAAVSLLWRVVTECRDTVSVLLDSCTAAWVGPYLPARYPDRSVIVALPQSAPVATSRVMARLSCDSARATKLSWLSVQAGATYVALTVAWYRSCAAA